MMRYINLTIISMFSQKGNLVLISPPSSCKLVILLLGAQPVVRIKLSFCLNPDNQSIRHWGEFS